MTPREYLASEMNSNIHNKVPEVTVSDVPQHQQQVQYPLHVEITEDSKGLAKVTASVSSLTTADDARNQCVELFIKTKEDLKQNGVKVAE
jgi:hypothetical protein